MESEDRTKAKSLREFRDGRDSNTLAEFPLAALTDRIPEGQKTLEFSDCIKDWTTGQTIERRIVITGSDRFGLPTAKDEDVLLALVQLTKLTNNFSSPEVEFTKHQVIELLGWDNRGWAYDRVEEALHRWKGCSVHYWNAWRDHGKGKWRDSEAIGIIEYFKVTDGRKRGKDERRSRFIWNSVLFQSFKDGYLKKLDFETYRRLERPVSRRAFRFLDKRFYHTPKWEFDLRVFACEKVGLSRGYDTGQLKARLKPAMEELAEIGFIEPVRYIKKAKKNWNIAIEKRLSAKQVEQPVRGESQVDVLVSRGVLPRIAAELVASYPAERIAEKLRLVEWLGGRNDKRLLQNPGGFLVAAIRDDYGLPKALQPKPPSSNPPQRTNRRRVRTSELTTSTTGDSSGSREDLTDAWFQAQPAAEQEKLLATIREALPAFKKKTLARLEHTGGALFTEYRSSLLNQFFPADKRSSDKSAA